MGFNINTGVDFLPIIKINSQAGRIYKVERTPNSDGSWNSEEIDITDGFAVAMDWRHAYEGGVSFANGAPNFVLVPIGEALPQMPTSGHNPTIRVRCYSEKLLDGVRDLTPTSKEVLRSLDGLYDEVTKAPEYKEDLVPVVKLDGMTPRKIRTPAGSSTIHRPAWSVVKWIARPEELAKIANDSDTPARPKRADQSNGEKIKPAQVVDDAADDDNESEF